jgi:hypothetical protein
MEVSLMVVLHLDVQVQQILAGAEEEEVLFKIVD